MEAIDAKDLDRAGEITKDIAWANETFIPGGNLEEFGKFNLQLEKIRFNEAGYCNAGPIRPPYDLVPEDYAEGARECGRRWAELVKKYTSTGVTAVTTDARDARSCPTTRSSSPTWSARSTRKTCRAWCFRCPEFQQFDEKLPTVVLGYTAGQIGVCVWNLEPGQQNDYHVHPTTEHLHIFIEGECEYTLGDQPPGHHPCR